MSKSKKVGLFLGACAAAVGLSVAVPQVHAQALLTSVKTAYLSSVSIQPESGVVAIQAMAEMVGDDGEPYGAPAILCPGANTEDGKHTAYVRDLPFYRTLIDHLLKNRGAGTIETRQERDGRCYVTRYSF